MDYNARFYDSYLNRWTQPDSIIPDGNPQSLNRYSYVLNSPIIFRDPTGHGQCTDLPEPAQSACLRTINAPIKLKELGVATSSVHLPTPAEMLSMAGIIVDGNWSDRDLRVAAGGVLSFGYALKAAGKGDTWYEAFRNVFGISNKSPLKFYWSDENPATVDGCTFGVGGCSPSVYRVSFVELCSVSGETCGQRNVVHELFHILDHHLAGGTGWSWASSNFFPSQYLGNRDSILRPNSGSDHWQFHADPATGGDGPVETFADFGVAWVYEGWNGNAYTSGTMAYGARNWMNDFMGSILP